MCAKTANQVNFKIGKGVYKKQFPVQLLVEENFNNIDTFKQNWSIEEKDTTYTLADGIMTWDSLTNLGYSSIWNKKFIGTSQSEGSYQGVPTIVQYYTKLLKGANNQNNVNVHLYGFIANGVNADSLLTTSHLRDGLNTEYYAFQNYRIHWVAPTMINPANVDNTSIKNWQLRFRVCPQMDKATDTSRKFNLYKGKKVTNDEWMKMTYVAEINGTMTIYVDDIPLVSYYDPNPTFYGYHALRTWHTLSQIKEYRIWGITS